MEICMFLMGREFGAFLAIASLVLGIMVLTGHGDFLLRNGRQDTRRDVFDEAKMQRSSGIMLLVFGVITGIDCFTTSSWAKIVYIVAIVVSFTVYIIYLRKYCMKK